jgi:ABC-type multidrug transport system fused ATPase/permease subunit
MATRMDELFDRIAALERELESEVNHARQNWRYRVEAGRVRFERDVRAVHRRLRHGIWRFLGESSLSSLVTAPVIYSLVVPIALLDLWITVYQAVCFRAYGIARVKRSSYIVVDRQHLAYLNAIEKLNCVYCGYTNGVFAYVREVAGRTEQYWCPIRHARAVRGPHPHYRHFIDYGDAEGYRKRWLPLRNELKDR